MTEIYVDADACPVKDEVMRVAERHDLPVHFVSNAFMRLPDDPLVRRVIVGNDADAADDWIAEHILAADVAVTADIPLAARCLEKGAAVIGPTGKPFTRDNIGNALALRALTSDLRDAGTIQTYNPSFTHKDRSHFLQALETAVRRQKKANRP
ncbi:MAG: YaiI/YqxD family protein [Pseudomonadota bacterium]